MMKFLGLSLALCLLICGCQPAPPEQVPGLKAFTGASLFDGRNEDLIPNAVIVVRDGKIESAGPNSTTDVPPGAETIDLAGKYVTPGWIVGHGHLGGAKGLETGPGVYTRENLVDQLGLYARYGSTSVLSLGGDGAEAIALRDEQSSADLNRSRLFVAGVIVDADTPDGARAQVDENVKMGVDWIKIRVDDNLGTTKKMTPEVYQAVIDQAHQHGKKVAAHLYYIDDAKGLLNAGVDLVAHSIRDKDVDDELIGLLKEKNICVCPTLTREVSTFVYEGVPEFFSDPFFLKNADNAVLEQLKDPARQQGIQKNKAAQQYKVALQMASRNLKKLVDSGVGIVFGTDTGPPARFQGYFEHMEMDLMVKAGLTPYQALFSANGGAARCLGMNNLGTLESGKAADFIVYGKNPLDDIGNTKTLESVWVAGNRVPEAGGSPGASD